MKHSGCNLITVTTLIFLLLTAIAAYPAAGSQSMADRATAALKAARRIKNPDTNEITNLILRERFEEFERLSENYEKRFLQDQLYESPLNKLYNALDCKNARLLAKLDKWVKKRPSYISYGARGVYKVNRGYEIRGCNYINETPPENIARMTQLHREARSDLLFAIQQNSKLTPAYCALILIEKATGSTDEMKKILDAAVRSIPETYYVRFTYLTSLHPRWGGSYAQMQEYADSLNNDALINPRIWSLKGEVPAERGFTAMLDKDYHQAIRFYTEALSSGERMSFLKNRGQMYMGVQQYDLALKDFLRYRTYDQSDKEVNGYIEYCKKRNPRSTY